MQILKKNIPILSILFVAAFMRLYRIADYMTFLGDEGRDVLVVKHILEGDLTLLGPRASAGDFFTGPVYYYMITPFLWLWGYDPVGPAIFIALLGVMTVFLIYYIGKQFFGVLPALMAAFLYAISPLVVTFSRSSWNPNPMPFFSLVIFFLLYKSIRAQSIKLFLLTGVLFGIAFQLHYIELFFAVSIALSIILGGYLTEKKKVIQRVSVQAMTMLGGFIIGISPFLLFELRHNFPNTRTIMGFVLSGTSVGQNTVNTPFYIKIYDVFTRVFGKLLGGFYVPNWDTLWYAQVFAAIFGVVLIGILFRHKDKLLVLMLFLWLVVGVILFGLYKKPIYDYYLEFMFPLPFLLFANFISEILKPKAAGALRKGVVLILLGLITVVSLSNHPFRNEPNRQKEQMEEIAQFVLSKTDDKPFNFALLASGNSDYAYRYFFEIADASPVTIENSENDPGRKTVTDQLLIVCEIECQPVGHPLWEIAGFGQAQISEEWEVSVVKVYKLIPYTESDSIQQLE